jgi:multidrug efflux pump subunit AcrA (membrane-fusion protein)
MQIEVALPNHDGTLLPGAFVQVALPLQASISLVIPANALLFRAEGLRVAVLDSADRVHLRQVQLGRNYGQTVEVLAGISATDRLVVNPADSVAEGDQVTLPAVGKGTP